MLMEKLQSLEDLQREGFDRILLSGDCEIYCKHDHVGNPQRIARYSIAEERIIGIWDAEDLEDWL